MAAATVVSLRISPQAPTGLFVVVTIEFFK